MHNLYLLLEVLTFSTVAFLVLRYCLTLGRKQDMEIDTFIHLYNFSILPEKYDEGFVADVEFIKTNRTKSKDFVKGSATLEAIAEDEKKGYDFLHLMYPVSTQGVAPHRHNKTKELIYIISGKILLNITEQDSGILPRWLKTVEGKSISVELGPRDWYFIKNPSIHSFSVIEDTEMLIVAKPPLFQKVGIFNDLRKKWFPRKQNDG